MHLYETLRNRQITIQEFAEPPMDMDPLSGFHMEVRYTNNGERSVIHGRIRLEPSTEDAILREIDGISDPPVRTPRSPAMRKRLGLE